LETFSTIPEWIKLEHESAEILTKQELHGWYFDERAAWELASTLRRELEQTYQLLRDRYPYVAGPVFTPKRNNRTQGYVKDAPFTRLKELNPTSRDHISWILQTFCGWNPTQKTTTGKPVIDEVILTEIGSPIAMQFARCLTVTKMLGMISEGANAWLKLSTTASRIHHHCSVATATFRQAHRNPNLAQVPSDPRFRQLFTASPGLVMVGADLAGIELRMLSHFLAKYDGGRYADILLMGQAMKKLDTAMTNFFHPRQRRKKDKRSEKHMLMRLKDSVISWMQLKKLQNVDTSKLSMTEKLSWIHRIKR
jgi:hypothetical protein